MVKIVVYAIAKNEAKHVYRWYDSVMEADRIVVVDTGSEDSTVSKLKKCPKVEVYHSTSQPFRFDSARNLAFDRASWDNDQTDDVMNYVYVWLDMDEVIEKGWAEHLRQIVKSSDPNVLAWNFRLDNGDVSYNRMSAHRSNFYWKYPAHEVLTYHSDFEQVYTGITIKHLPDMGKPRNYLPLLELGAEQYKDARSYRYYARELTYAGRDAEAIPIYTKAAELEQNPLLECEIYIALGECYWREGNEEFAEQSFLAAAWNAPYVREGWGSLANFCFHTQRHDLALSALHQMLKVTEAPQHTIMRYDPYYHDWPYHMLASVYHACGQQDKAEEYIEKAIMLNPRDIHVLKDFATIKGLTFDKLTIVES